MSAFGISAAETDGIVKEAESAVLIGSRSFDDPAASGAKTVGWMGSVRFDHAPAANCLRLRYAWNAPVQALITVNDRPARVVPMMGGQKISGTYLERTIWIDIPADATVTVAGGFNFDCLTFVTAPSPAKIPPVEIPSPFPASAPRWDLSSDDTLATVAVHEGRPCLVSLKNRKQQWEWIRQVRPMPLLPEVVIEDRDVPLHWTYRDTVRDEAAGTLTMRFTCAEPALELLSRWRARPGTGPVEHLPTLINRGTKRLVVPTDVLAAADLDLAADQALRPVRLGQPNLVGYYGDGSETLAMPYEILQAGAAHGLYLAYDFDFGIGLTGLDAQHARTARHRFAVSSGRLVPPGPVTHLSKSIQRSVPGTQLIVLDPGQELVGPGMHHLAYVGDEDDGANRFRRWFWKYEIPACLRDDPRRPLIEICTGPTLDGNPDGLIALVKSGKLNAMGAEMLKTDLWHLKTGHAKRAELAEVCRAHGMELRLYVGGSVANGLTRKLWEEVGAHGRSDSAYGGQVYPPGDYHSARRLYRFLDETTALSKGRWDYQNCSNGGNHRSMDIFRRMSGISHSDTPGLHVFFQHVSDWSYLLAPAQMSSHIGFGEVEGLYKPTPGEVADFRCLLLGAILTGFPEYWTPEFIARFREVCKLYKTRQRAILRGADIYHIAPAKPWLGIQYDNPAIGKGSVLLWQNGGPASQTIKLKGLDRAKTYTLTFQDDPAQNSKRAGGTLMDDGIVVRMGANASEIIWIE